MKLSLRYCNVCDLHTGTYLKDIKCPVCDTLYPEPVPRETTRRAVVDFKEARFLIQGMSQTLEIVRVVTPSMPAERRAVIADLLRRAQAWLRVFRDF